MKKSCPFVSIVMPIRNEAKFISQSLKCVLDQEYLPDRNEVIVVDGLSDDGTREILKEFDSLTSRLTFLDNPRRTRATALNIGIESAKGEVVVFIDGHVEVASDFVQNCVELLDEHPEAWGVGGPIRHAGNSRFGMAVALAMSHPCGVGNASHRFSTYEGYGEGTAFPAIRRWVFDNIGGFDPRMVRTEDDEFYFRMRQAGGKFYISPRVRFRYFVRERIAQLFCQYFQYSFWRIPVIRKHRQITTVRQVVPTVFYMIMIGMFLTGMWLGKPSIALFLPILYASVLASLAVTFIRQAGLGVAALVPIAMATMHAAYAMGLLYGLWTVWFRREMWNESGSMAGLTR